MSTRNRLSLATLALLAAGCVALVAYAADNDRANTNANQPNANAANTIPANTNQPNAGQSSRGQPQPYQVNMNPGAIGQGAAGQNGRQDVDLFLIPCLINASNAEVTLGRLAEQRSQSSEVKDFAQEMVKDHSAQLRDLQELQTKLTGALHPRNPNSTPVAAALFEINQEIEQTCLANAQRELEQQSGAEFDRCYIGSQVGMHMQLESVLTVFKNHVQSPEFKKAIDDASQLVSRHLERAKKLAKDLERGSSGNNSSARANR